MNFEQWCKERTDIGELAHSMKSSIPEQYIGFYLSKVFDDIEYQRQFDWLEAKSLDIYIPSMKLAIEYDGSYYHSDSRRPSDLEKNSLCLSKGIDVIRILERESVAFGKKETKCKWDEIEYFLKKKYSNIHEAIEKLVLLINKKYKLSLHVDVNLARDEKEILRYVQMKYHQKTIAYVWPETNDYWDVRANDRSYFDVFYTNHKCCYQLKCPKCNAVFTLHMRYCYERKSLCPCKNCELSEVECDLKNAIYNYVSRGELISFDGSLRSRRLYDRIVSKMKSMDASKEEIMLYKKSGVESEYLDRCLSNLD